MIMLIINDKWYEKDIFFNNSFVGVGGVQA